jgi:WD40 repeat protein
MHDPQERPRSASLRVVVGLVVAAVAVGGVASVIVYPRQQPTVTQQSPPAIAVTPIKVPPAGQSLLWFRDSNAQGKFVLRAVNWTGKVEGGMSVSCFVCGVAASPDGQRLLIGDQSAPGRVPDQDRVFSAAGRQLAVVDGFGAQWSDDGARLCALRAPTNQNALQGASTADLWMTNISTGDVRSVASVSVDGAIGSGSWMLLSCSIGADRAVIAFEADGVKALRVVQLSTGRTVFSGDGFAVNSACLCPIGSVVVSGDGTMAVEDEAATGNVLAIDLRTGGDIRMTGSWSGRGPVLDLSWSGHLAMTPLGVYTFPTGTALWKAPMPAYLAPSGSRPHGDELLLALSVASATAAQPVIVLDDGTLLKLPASYISQPPPPF